MLRLSRKLTFVLLIGLALCAGSSSVLRAGNVAAVTRLYVFDDGTPSVIQAYNVSSAGEMTALANSPFDTGTTDGGANGQVASLAYSASKGLLFASGGAGISVLKIQNDGTLDLVPGSPFKGRDDFNGGWGVAAVDLGASTFVYASDRLRNQLAGFAVDANGVLTELPSSPIATGAHPDGMASAGPVVAVANGGEATVSTFVCQADGSLKKSGKKPSKTKADDIYQLFMDAAGKNVYVPDDGSSQGRVFTFSASSKGKLKKVKHSPFNTSGPITVSGMAVGAKFLYTLGDGNPDIQIMSRGKKGALANVATFDSQTNNPAAINLSASGTLAAVASDIGDKIATFTVNPQTGALTAADSKDVVMTNVGQVLFVTR